VFLWGRIREVNVGTGISPRSIFTGVRPHVAETELLPPPKQPKCTVTTFLKTDSQKLFTHMAYVHADFHMPNRNVSVVYAKRKAHSNLPTVVILSLYIP
jgi:hypothetical protein